MNKYIFNVPLRMSKTVEIVASSLDEAKDLLAVDPEIVQTWDDPETGFSWDGEPYKAVLVAIVATG